jgi:phosphate transport system permease protein
MKLRRRAVLDTAFGLLAGSAAAAIPILAAATLLILIIESWPVLARMGDYQLINSATWRPKPHDGSTPIYGALAFVYGTIITAAIAMLIALPLGVGSAAFLADVAPARVRRIGATLVQLLAAIPSVVYGAWGLFVLAPVLQALFSAIGGPNTGGTGLLAAGLVLAIMVVPYVTAISLDACRAVPRRDRESAYALGASRAQVIRHIVLPGARPGIIAAAFLALGRALGETMAVTMLIGGTPIVSVSFFATGDSIASKIAASLNEADDATTRAALTALALVLVLVTTVLNAIARWLIARMNRRPVPPTAEPITTLPAATKPIIEPLRKLLPMRRSSGRMVIAMVTVAFVLTVGPLFLILGQIAVRGAQAIEASMLLRDASAPEMTNSQYATFHLTGSASDEIGRPIRRGGFGHALLGSLLIVGLASLLAVPVAILAAAYLANAPNTRWAAIVRFVAELLAGVPSIVFGMLAFAVLVLPSYAMLRGDDAAPLNYSAWAGAVAVALLMLPRTAEEALRAVPGSLVEASHALGASRTQTLFQVALPVAWPGIVTGILLAVGRAIGETAPLLLTAGYSVDWPRTPSDATPFLTGLLYRDSRSPSHDLQDQAWSAALVLMIAVMVLNIGIRRRIKLTGSN